MPHTNEDRKAIERFVQRAVRFRRAETAAKGQALVEFALMVPILFLLIVNAVNFGGFFYGWITVANAARAASQYAILGASSLGLPRPASATQLQTLVTNETSSLPGASSTNPTVTACENDNGTVFSFPQTTPKTDCPAGVTAPPTDPEAPSYVTLAVDVTYTYPSFFGGTNFMGLPLTVFPNGGVIHRRAVMRMIQ